MPTGVAEDVSNHVHRGSFTEEQGDVEVAGEWQDKTEFERQQEVVQGDIGKRDNAIDGGFEDEGGLVPRVIATWDPIDKEARREAKKERNKKIKKENAARMLREKDAEQG